MRSRSPRVRSRSPESTLGRGISLGELAGIAQGILVGPADLLIRGVAETEKAGPDQITYAVNRQYLESARSSRAGAVVVPMSVASLDRPIIRTENPYWSFARIIERFQPSTARWRPGVSPLAYVATTAKLGRSVVVRPFAVIEEGATIGDRAVVESGAYVGPQARLGEDSLIHANATIGPRTIIGRRVIVQSSAVVGADGFGYATKDGVHHRIPQIGIVEIGDDVEIGAGTTIDRATLGRTVVAQGTKIDNLVQIGHNVEIGPGCLIVAQVGLSGSTRVGANCRFAGQAATSGHLAIGDNCTVAARGVATKDVPAGSVVSGFPARPHGEEKRVQASLRRLPDVLRRLRALEAKVGLGDDEEEDQGSEP